MRAGYRMVVLRHDKMGAGWGLVGLIIERLVVWNSKMGLVCWKRLKSGLFEDVGEPGKVVGYLDCVVLDER